MSAGRQPWLLFMPDGSFDGLCWSPETQQEAQRLFARMCRQRWATLERKGWSVRRGVDDEHIAALNAAMVAALRGGSS